MFRAFCSALPMLFLPGCGGNSSSSTTPSTPAAPTPTVTSIAVNGTAAAAGETAQFTATATLSNGTTDNVTARATWESSNDAVATVSSAGVVKSIAAGDSDITATYAGGKGSLHVRIDGRIVAGAWLSGMITDTDTGRAIVDGAEAQVMDGDNAGRVGRVDVNGVYSISDLSPGVFMLRARANGYESRDHQMTLGAADVRVDFELRALPRQATCTYTVTPGVLWMSLGGYPEAYVRVTTSRAGCSWTATATNHRYYLAEARQGTTWPIGSGHEISGTDSMNISVVTNAVPSRACVWTDTIKVRWSGGGSDVTVKQPIFTPPLQPQPCQ